MATVNTNSSNNNSSEPLAIAQGGTNSSTVTSAPAASAWAGWDANSNMSANSFISSYTTTATASGTTTLTVSSTQTQYFTGSLNQTLKMPVTSTLVLGQSFTVVNLSAGNLTIQSSGANQIVQLSQNESAVLTCILTSGTTASSWSYIASAFVGTNTLPVAGGGTGYQTVQASNNANAHWIGSDSNGVVPALGFRPAYTTTATAAGTTTLTVTSNQQQYFTGSTTQTVQMPVTSTLTLGYTYTIVNNSTGNVTVNSSGSNAIVVLYPGTAAVLTCILTSGTTAASWSYAYYPSTTQGSAGAVLTSNGAGNTPSFQAATSTGGVNKVVIQTFTSSGTYTPSAGLLYCVIECVGAGGGGGGTASAASTVLSYGSGAGGGSYAKKTASAATIGASQTVTIGAAGTAGASGNNNGGNGGTTSVGSICVANGGSGGVGNPGTNTSYAAGASGGTVGTGDVTISGFDGISGYASTSYIPGIYGRGGFAAYGFGSGGGSGGYSPPNNGFYGQGYGGGGGGGSSYNADGAASGGVGLAGYVTITEYTT